jgi:four helix bundle protein
MATIKRFEDLECWQLAREVCQKIDSIIKTTDLIRNYKLRDQIDASSGSTMDNISEGFGRLGNKEFCHFLTIASGSCNETQSQLYRILDKGIIDQHKFDEIYNLISTCRVKIMNLLEYLQKCEERGVKFR